MGDSRVALLETNSHDVFFVNVISNTTAIIMITIFIIDIVYFADSFLHNCCLSWKLNLVPQMILKEKRV
jgi:hypothetical protein